MKILNLIRRRGAINCLNILINIIKDKFFDLKYGTDTVLSVRLENLNINSKNKNLGSEYAGSRTSSFIKLISTLGLPKNHQDVFCDIGSGKGKILLSASLLGFNKIIGVEFSNQLCEIAQQNINKFKLKKPESSPIEVYNCDAVSFEFPKTVSCIYMFNPFDKVILQEVMKNIKISISKDPRPLNLIYLNPLHSSVIEDANLFNEKKEYLVEGDFFVVYSIH